MSAESPTSVARYRRTVAASLERVWENVHDWEHLPWLHQSTFAAIRHLDSGDWGWRARVALQPGRAGNAFTLELVVDREQGRYVARTLEGTGKGTEIWTRLDPIDARHTDIEVDFRLPGVAPESRDALGRVYTNLYRQLWDEDEAMMRQRAAQLGGRRTGAAGPVALGPVDAVRARLPCTVSWGGRRWRVVELDGALVAHAARCPHWLGPLDGAPLVDGCLTCPWHGYRFDLRSGRSADGRGLRLPPAPRVVVDPRTREVRLERPD